MMNRKALLLFLLSLFALPSMVFAHGEGGGEAVALAGSLSWGFMAFGILVISVVGIILFTKKASEQSAEAFAAQQGLGGYITRMRMFSSNARLYMIHVVGMDVIHGTWEVVFNLYLLAIGFDVSFIGLRILIRAISAGVMYIPAGLISDRIGRKMSFILGDGMGAIMSLIAISTGNPILILGTAAIGGVFGSLHGVSEAAFMAENSEDYERIHLFSVADGTRTAAAIIGSVLAGLVPLLLANGDTETLVNMYRLVAYLGIVIWFTSLIPALLLKQGTLEKNKVPLTLRTMFSNVKNPDLILKLSLPAAIIGFGAGFTLPLMNVYFHEGLGTTEIEIGVIFAAGQALLVVASFLAPFIAIRLGKVRAIVLTQLVSVPFIVLLGYVAELSDVVGSFVVVAVIAYVARITTMDVSGPIREAFGMELLDPSERGTQVGIQRALAAGLFGLAGFFGGQMMDAGDFRTPFFIMAALNLCSVTLFWMFFGRQKKAVLDVELVGQGTD
jgi:MFS family permease